MADDRFIRVAVPAPLYTEFHYLPPPGIEVERLRPGVRVRVPFGRGERIGVILDVDESASWEEGRVKPAMMLLDEDPLLSPEDLSLLTWVARYYQYPIGEVVASALPVRLRRGEPLVDLHEKGWTLTSEGADVEIASLIRAPRQQQIMQLLQNAQEPITQRSIYERHGPAYGVLKSITDKGWIEPCSIVPKLMQPASDRAGVEALPELHPEQQDAVEQVARDWGRFGVSLLEGVTGSGKTEVYLRLVEQAISQNRQVLLLVPEIGLTPQLLERFERRLTTPLALLHSGLSEGERERAWHRARQGLVRVVIGTRSALFTPMPDLGLILVDEEHDLSFKQQDGFRYSARDISVIRAQRAGCPVVLGSATPSLESIHNALQGRYRHLRLTQRAGLAQPPKFDLLDIRSARLDGGLSSVLIKMIGETLSRGEQVILFLNRRGYSPVLMCHDCGWTAQCQRCDAKMTLHMGNARLWCHHCDTQRPMVHKCPECDGEDVRPLGQGTERLEQVLKQHFPDSAIARIDRDTTRQKGSLQEMLEGIRRGDYPLMLGTQMLAKGHHFPNVTLVGILDLDQGLFGADFRAGERMAQLLIQVAGRAGRGERSGRVVLQTRHPEHPLLQTLITRGYPAFARLALAERKEAGFPPFSYQTLLRAEAPGIAEPRAFLEAAAKEVKALAGDDVEVWGPVSAPMERRAGRYRVQLLLQASERSKLQRLLSVWMPTLSKLPGARKVRWSIDVDPQEML